MIENPIPSEAVRQQNWLRSILLKHGRRLFDRCAHFYSRLCALPRTTRRRLQATAGAGLTTLALALALSGAPTVQAATITVDGDGSGGTCSLTDAVTAANSNMATGNCIAGDDAGGYDTIDIQAATAAAVGLDLTSNIVINGNGNTIQSNNTDRVFTVSGGITVVINEATITGGNAASGGGGGIFNSGTLEINRSTISGNQTAATGSGGGISNSGTVTLNNSTITGNSASYGGGVSNQAAAATITMNNSTITNNTAAQVGGGIEVFDGEVTLNRTIVSGNSDTGGGAEIYNIYTLNLDSYNLIGYGGANRSTGITVGGSDIVPAEPLNAVLDTTLANNGVQPHADTHALVAGSPALDVVPNGQSTGGIDQRGAARDIDADGGDGNTTNLGDIGAFEYLSPQTPTAVVMGRSGAEAESSAGITAVFTAALSTLLLAAGTAWATLWRRRQF